MSEIGNIISCLQGTQEEEILKQMEKVYSNITNQQAVWYEKSRFVCAEGCGSCCHDFEPDLLECEALYMAAWLLENQPEVAEKIIQGKYPFENGKTCPFHNFENKYHCSIYNGRPSICRLFGACGNRGKDGKIVWKPCKFYSDSLLNVHKPKLEHRQYNTEEVLEIFGLLPPVMSDLMEEAVSIIPDNHITKTIREILPETISRLQWIISLNS